MIRLKKEAKEEIKEHLKFLLKVIWIFCGGLSTLCYGGLCFFGIIDKLIFPEYPILTNVKSLSIVSCVIMIISTIPLVYLLAKKIVDSFEVVPRKTKKEKILESDKILEYDEEDMLQNMTIQDLLDYYKERDLVFYEFLISACNDLSSMEETHVKYAISVLIEYSDLYIDSPTFGEYTEYERTTLHTEIMEHLGNILNRLVTFNQKKWRMK